MGMSDLAAVVVEQEGTNYTILVFCGVSPMTFDLYLPRCLTTDGGDSLNARQQGA